MRYMKYKRNIKRGGKGKRNLKFSEMMAVCGHWEGRDRQCVCNIGVRSLYHFSVA